MFRRTKNSLSIVIFLLGWLTTQAAALHHEFSEEHWQSIDHEVCLAQASYNDDIFVAHSPASCFPLNLAAPNFQFSVNEALCFANQSPLQARAPPLSHL
ncbi:hypothetical protein FLL45_20620 [Aliikangiella marina]|uniref:Uncharacterized protein n=1 Tax=Aliikangiella marina TaxID=1712262 RepID=A0A545T2W3_9GAMM|nr:hypothetical protein [Aliikangiella marina]TQV71556.1 hypothetical protein FLL45_20620 [Aliikangiella marina]